MLLVWSRNPAMTSHCKVQLGSGEVAQQHMESMDVPSLASLFGSRKCSGGREEAASTTSVKEMG